MFCQTENIGHDDRLNPNFDRLAIEISICVLSTISIRIPLVSPASELTPEQDSTGRETFPQVPLNYSNIQYQWHVTKRHPGQLEARIS